MIARRGHVRARTFAVDNVALFGRVEAVSATGSTGSHLYLLFGSPQRADRRHRFQRRPASIFFPAWMTAPRGVSRRGGRPRCGDRRGSLEGFFVGGTSCCTVQRGYLLSGPDNSLYGTRFVFRLHHSTSSGWGPTVRLHCGPQAAPLRPEWRPREGLWKNDDRRWLPLGRYESKADPVTLYVS